MKNYILNITKTTAFLVLALFTFISIALELLPEGTAKSLLGNVFYALVLIGQFQYISQARGEFGLSKLDHFDSVKLGFRYLLSALKVIVVFSLIAMAIVLIGVLFFGPELKSLFLSGEKLETDKVAMILLPIASVVSFLFYVWLNLVFIERKVNGSLKRVVKIIAKHFKSFAVLLLASVSITVFDYFLLQSHETGGFQFLKLALFCVLQISWILGGTWYVFKSLLAIPEVSQQA